MASNPVTFFIRIILPKACQPPEGISLDNDKTKERLRSKMGKGHPNLEKCEKILLCISRIPLASTKILIGSKDLYQKRIYLTKELTVVAI
jgi:hypothetical protein